MGGAGGGGCVGGAGGGGCVGSAGGGGDKDNVMGCSCSGLSCLSTRVYPVGATCANRQRSPNLQGRPWINDQHGPAPTLGSTLGKTNEEED